MALLFSSFCYRHGSNVKQERDVLNDIGSMLEDLTSELDAMLDTDMAWYDTASYSVFPLSLAILPTLS